MCVCWYVGVLPHLHESSRLNDDCNDRRLHPGLLANFFISIIFEIWDHSIDKGGCSPDFPGLMMPLRGATEDSKTAEA